MTLRRRLRFAALATFAVLAGWAGLSWYNHYRAEQAVAALRLMGAEVEEQNEPQDWWRRIATSVGVSPSRGPFSRTTISVHIRGSAATKEAVRVAAGHPGLEKLAIEDAPAFDDDALDAARGCSVTNLYLSNVGVGDAGLRHLAEWKKLRIVWLLGCPITDVGVGHLCGLPSVEYVTCDGAGQIGRAHV